MELLQMKYFLAVAREENISKAADFLYITQPSLTRQIQSMEKEVGQPLFIRGGRKMLLTEAGILLRKHAREILALYEKAESEWMNPDGDVSGDVFIGGGETYGMTFITNVVSEMRKNFPNVKIHLYSGDMADVCERLDKGILDFGLLIQPADLTKYESLRLPYTDKWGLLMHKEHVLAKKEFITPQDLSNIPLIQSRHSLPNSALTEWYKFANDIEIVGTYNLINNAALMAQAKIGCVLGIDNIINTSKDGNLVFRPLKPAVEAELDVVWKKYQTFSKTAQIFLKYLREKLHRPI